MNDAQPKDEMCRPGGGGNLPGYERFALPVSPVRVSSQDQVHGHPLDAQARLFYELCINRGWEPGIGKTRTAFPQGARTNHSLGIPPREKQGG